MEKEDIPYFIQIRGCINCSASKKLKDLNSENNTSDSGAPSNNFINKRINLFYEVDVDRNYRVTVDEMINYYKGKVKNKMKPKRP